MQLSVPSTIPAINCLMNKMLSKDTFPTTTCEEEEEDLIWWKQVWQSKRSRWAVWRMLWPSSSIWRADRVAVYVVVAQPGLQKQFSSLPPQNPVRIPRAVWPPAACGREITINNDKSESQKAWNVLSLSVRPHSPTTPPTPVCHCESSLRRVIWICVILEGWCTCTMRGHGCGKEQLNALTNLIWLTT